MLRLQLTSRGLGVSLRRPVTREQLSRGTSRPSTGIANFFGGSEGLQSPSFSRTLPAAFGASGAASLDTWGGRRNSTELSRLHNVVVVPNPLSPVASVLKEAKSEVKGLHGSSDSMSLDDGFESLPDSMEAPESPVRASVESKAATPCCERKTPRMVLWRRSGPMGLNCRLRHCLAPQEVSLMSRKPAAASYFHDRRRTAQREKRQRRGAIAACA